MKYKITNVIDTETGVKAVDNDRRNRIGRIVEDLFPFTIGDQAQFINDDYSMTRTSTIQSIEETEEKVRLTTKNSIYLLNKIKE
jgi:hypothetical protein